MNLAFVARAVGVTLLLSACATTSPTTPFRLADMPAPGPGQSAFVWTSGLSNFVVYFNLQDYATITRIDAANVPADYLPAAGNPPWWSWLLEISAGNHDIEILYKEAFPICCLVTENYRRTITLMAEPNRIYAPFVSDECGRDWFWIEDRGPYVPGMGTHVTIIDVLSDLTKPVVAGEAPPKECK